MPELPEVASFQNFLNEHALHKKIKEVEVKDSYVFRNTSISRLESILKGNVFEESFRRGKYLFVKLKVKGNLLFHFGMTGYFEIYDPQQEPPKYAQLLLQFSKPSGFTFISKRKLGRVEIVENVEKYIQDKKIGVDALDVTQKDFIRMISSRSGKIKAQLMNQNLLAGIGNEFADEILYQAKIHPESRANEIPEKKLKQLFAKQQEVLKAAVKVNADRDKLEKYFFLDNRKAGLDCPCGKGKTEKIEIGGRSTYFCSQCQSKYS